MMLWEDCTNPHKTMLKAQKERIENAANAAVKVFVEHGLTLKESEYAADRIKYMVRLQGEETKVDFEAVCIAVKQDDGMLVEVLKETRQALAESWNVNLQIEVSVLLSVDGDAGNIAVGTFC